MNRLILGLSDKTDDLQCKPPFLLIDDGPICDAFKQRYSRAKIFDPSEHSFNPLKEITYQRAREFASVIFGSEGKDTLTVRNGKRALTRILLNSEHLDALSVGKSDPEKEAQATIDDVLLSPTLRSVLCKPTNFSFREGRSTIIARVDRAVLGDYDAHILAALLIQQFSGQVIIPDFGFYARPFHTQLIRQNRLIAGVFTLSELEPKMRQLCLLMEKIGRQCTHQDAETLAEYEELKRDTVGYNDLVDSLMSA